MMTDYVNYTGDEGFRDTVLVPLAREVRLFFDRHYPRDANGKIRLDPAMSLETWWIAVNPAPDVAGLQFCLDALLSMGAGTPEDQDAFHYKCWPQDQIHWAYAGRAAEAQEGLVHRFRHASSECRFPLHGSAGPDSCPDFDHFGSGATAFQRMLV